MALGSDVVALLQRHRKASRRAEHHPASDGPLWQDHDLVFPSEIGTLLEDKRVHHVFRRICELAGVPKIRPYDLRHTCATLLLAQGEQPRTIMDILGHSQIGLTMNTYAHVMPSLRREAADKMDAILAKKQIP